MTVPSDLYPKLFCLLLLLRITSAVPLSKHKVRQHHRGRIAGSSNQLQYAMNYLVKYGYLREINHFELRSKNEFDDAIEKFQLFSKINRTGALDENTMRKMKIPRCGVRDIPSIFNDFDVEQPMPFTFQYFPEKTDLGRTRFGNREISLNHERQKRFALMGKWPKNDITYRFGSYTQDMSVLRQRKEIARAFRIWSEATPLSFREVWLEDADILISFLRGFHDDGYPFDGNGQTLAHAFFPGQGSRSGDAHFDEDETWTDATEESKGTNLYMVAAHEFGHALGLGHSSHPYSVMLPFYQGYMENFSLGEDDKRAIQLLYGNTYSESNVGAIYQGNNDLFPPPTSTSDGSALDNDDFARDGRQLSREKVPDVCNYNFDAVANIRNNIFFIKGNVFWRIDDRGVLVSNEEMLMTSFWNGFPDVRVDAAFTRPTDQNIIFISGDQYWMYINNNDMDPSSPRNISDFGLKMGETVDAAWIWNANKRTYIFKGNEFWKLNAKLDATLAGYPRGMEKIEGIPGNLDAAFTGPDGHAYFLKGKLCWRLEDNTLRTFPGYPKYTGERWFGCDAAKYQTESYTTSASIAEEDFSTTKGNGAFRKYQIGLQFYLTMFFIANMIFNFSRDHPG